MLLLVFCALGFTQDLLSDDSFRFVLLGDRTGEAVPGMFEAALQDVAAQHPAFVLTVGDAIQGGADATAAAEWRQFRTLLRRYPGLRFELTAGNHDIWSPASEQLFRQYARRPLHYSFDSGSAHFTVLDTSRSDQLSPTETQFLVADLQAHNQAKWKFIVTHRPFWLISALFGDTHSFPQQIAKKYGVQFLVAGHVHRMMYAQMDGVSYLSLPSAGGHLRDSQRYEDGWFFGTTAVTVQDSGVKFSIRELDKPFGSGRKTEPVDWGFAGLRQR